MAVVVDVGVGEVVDFFLLDLIAELVFGLFFLNLFRLCHAFPGCRR